MELEITRRTVPEGAVAPAQMTELPIECDVLLPDYCPDILKILRCSAEVCLAGTRVSDGRLTAEGVTLVTVHYLSDGMELCRSEQRLPFSKSFDFACGGERFAAAVSPEVENVNCRAVSPRRIDVRGAFSLTAKLICMREGQAVAEAPAGVELLTEKRGFTDIIGEYGRAFTVRETGEIGHGKPEAASVLRASGSARVTECRVIQDKLVTKGEVEVSVLWLPQEGGDEGPQRSAFVFPAGQMLDAPGADESVVCDARYRLQGLTVAIAEDGHSFEVEAAVFAFARLQNEAEETAAADAYSVKYRCDCTPGELSALRVLAPVSETLALDETLELPEGVAEILDCWAETPYPPELGDDGALSCRARLCIFARDGEGATEFFEKTLAAATPALFSPDGGAIFVDVDLAAAEADCVMEGGKARASLKLHCDGCIFGTKKYPVLSDIAVDDERPSERPEPPALTIYYADGGERVWDIAKRCGSTPAAVSAENGLTADTIPERCMLLIPFA